MLTDRFFGVLLLLIASCAPALATDDRTYSLATDSGSHGTVVVKGTKATLTITDLNWVRYRYELQRTDEKIAGPDPLSVLPSFPKQTAPANAASLKSQMDPPEKRKSLSECRVVAGWQADDFRQCFLVIHSAALDAFDAGNLQLDTAGARAQQVHSFVRTSSWKTDGNAVKKQLSDLGGALRPTSVQSCEGVLWSECAVRLKNQRDTLRDVMPGEGMAYQAARAELASLDRTLDRLTDLKTDWEKALQHLTELQDRLQESYSRLQSDPNEPNGGSIRKVNQCPIAMGSRTTWRLAITDILAAKGEDGSAEKPHMRDLIVYLCRPRISVSAGVATSTLDERTFKFVAAPTSAEPQARLGLGVVPQQADGNTGNGGSETPRVIAFDRVSDFRVVPMALSHVRFAAWSFLAFHASLGAGADTVGEGLDLEILAGPSVSIADRLFLTLGFQWGRVDKLSDGFVTGSPAPANLSEPPTQRSRDSGFGFAMSWSFSPSTGGAKDDSKKD